MEIKKSGKGLKVLVWLLAVLLIAAIGYILADKFIFNEKQENNATDNATTIADDAKTTSNEWSLFAKNMIDKRKTAGLVFSDTISGDGESNKCYSLDLDKDGTLGFYQCILSEKEEIAKNVLFFSSIQLGGENGETLFYVTEDGETYKVNNIQKVVNESFLSPDKINIETTKIEAAKEVVNIIPGVVSEEGGVAYFIDINGNIYKY